MRAVLFILITACALLGFTYLGTIINLYPWIIHYPINMGFLVFLTIVSDAINERALEQKGRSVIIPYLVSTMLKLIFSAIFLILFIRQNMDSAREIVFSFLTYYSFFSALEIIIVNKRLRPKKF